MASDDKGSRSPFSTIASQGADSQFFRLHHQRGAESYTFGQGGMRTVKVDFRGDILRIIYTRTTTHPAGIHNTHALINEHRYAQGDQYTRHDQSPSNQYTRRTSTTVTTPHPWTDKRTHIRTRRPVHTSRQVTTESVHAAHIDYGHNAQSAHNNKTPPGRIAPIPRHPPPPHTHTAPQTAGPTKPTPTDTLHSTNPRSLAVSSGLRDTGN